MYKREDLHAYFLGGFCVGVIVCYIILWLSLHVL
jgi:hypothetical protein